MLFLLCINAGKRHNLRRKGAVDMENKPRNEEKEPVARAEDVEYSRKFADEDDREATERAKRADQRAE